MLKDFKYIFLLAFVVGLIVDWPYGFIVVATRLFVVDFPGGHESIPGFFIIIPLLVFLLIFIFKISNEKSRIIIILISVALFVTGVEFGYYQWSELRNYGVGSESDLTYYIAIIPSIVAGAFFGFLISRRIREIDQKYNINSI